MTRQHSLSPNKPGLKLYREAFKIVPGFKSSDREAATEALASWLLRYSAMFDYDSADVKDARAIAQELLGTRPRELHKVRHVARAD
jgi:hypothetical protein